MHPLVQSAQDQQQLIQAVASALEDTSAKAFLNLNTLSVEKFHNNLDGEDEIMEQIEDEPDQFLQIAQAHAQGLSYATLAKQWLHDNGVID